jgi:hypothetical protein
LDKNRANKLDQLFQEKLQEHEISPEEDYWPYLEKNLSKISFYKFGWKHINIYNLSLGVLLLAIPVIYALFQSNKKTTDPSYPPQEIIDSVKKSEAPKKDPVSVEAAIQPIPKKQIKAKLLKPDRIATNSEVKTKDSLPTTVPTEDTTPTLPEPFKTIEKKQKPKKIIYVVQQDTIVEKDTVKVRRKRKK